MRDVQQPAEQHSQEFTLDIHALFSFCKKHYVLLFLLAFMLYGFYLRSYHMDFPVIGYHNMKENQYIPYTEFMYNAEEFLDYFRTETYWIGSQEHGYFTQYEFPLIPWMILVLWWIFGIKLWAARLVVILFSIGSIPLLYLLGRKLTENKFILLLACFLFTIMPLSVFFGRNVQPEAPALFFILLGSYWFFRWREKMLLGENSLKVFVLFSISFLIAILLKVPNAIGLVPLLFFVPYKKFISSQRVFLECTGIFLSTMFIFPLWVFFSKWVMPGAATVGTSGFTESFRAVAHNVLRTLTSAYWFEYFPALRSFVLDNFTVWYFWLFLLGVFFALFTWRSLFSRFLLTWFGSIFVYVLAFADKVRGHAYYQFVFLPLVCFAAAYALYMVSQFLQQVLSQSIPSLKSFFSKAPLLFPLIVSGLVIFLSFAFVTAATDQVFDTIYYGEDIAGDF
ncbi:MAG: glycosyltransferase family 39 protein, partial [Nanoarchaeota archaeon]